MRVPSGAAARPAPIATGPWSVTASIDAWSAHYGVDARLARAIAWQESGFHINILSPAGAWGPMQVLPGTWSYVEDVLIGHPVARTADGDVRIGVALLHHLIGAFGGNERRAVAAYYQGESSVRERGMLDRDAVVRRRRHGAAQPHVATRGGQPGSRRAATRASACRRRRLAHLRAEREHGRIGDAVVRVQAVAAAADEARVGQQRQVLGDVRLGCTRGHRRGCRRCARPRTAGRAGADGSARPATGTARRSQLPLPG